MRYAVFVVLTLGTFLISAWLAVPALLTGVAIVEQARRQ